MAASAPRRARGVPGERRWGQAGHNSSGLAEGRRCRMPRLSRGGPALPHRHHVDRPRRAQASVHLRRAGARHPDARAADDPADARRHLPRHRHPCRRRHLDLQRPQRGRDGQSDGVDLRARADDHRRRHRAHRVADDPWHLRGQGLLPTERTDRDGGRPGDRHLAIDAAVDAAGNEPAVRQRLQRFDGSGPDAGAVRRQPVRAAVVRLRGQLPAGPVGDGPGRLDSPAVRREAAADPGGPEP